MIIECEKCITKFSLDESLLNKEGSTVRCSVCKHVFAAYPAEHVFPEEAEAIAITKKEFEEAPMKDLSTVPHEEVTEANGKDQEDDFDSLFEESLENLEEDETVSPQDLYDLPDEESASIEDSPDTAYMKEDFFLTDTEETTEDEAQLLAETDLAVPGHGKAPKSHFLTISLVIILALTSGAAAIVFLAPGLIPDSLSFLRPAEKLGVSDAAGLRRLSFKEVTGAFIESKDAGRLFVIQGTVMNNYPKKRSFILVKGSILDDKGQVVKRKLAYAGNKFKDGEIEIAPLEEIDKAMKNRYGVGRSNLNVASEGSVPFTLVFENLPENLSEFTVEAVSSSPGT
jgi:predicted Zn finger-like uncharacterized protein